MGFITPRSEVQVLPPLLIDSLTGSVSPTERCSSCFYLLNDATAAPKGHERVDICILLFDELLRSFQ